MILAVPILLVCLAFTPLALLWVALRDVARIMREPKPKRWDKPAM